MFLQRPLVTALILLLAARVSAEVAATGPPSPAPPEPSAAAKTATETKESRPQPTGRTALENKLRVEKVVVKGATEKGVEIEVRYRIVDVEGYAASPKTSFVADEASATLVPLRKLQKLFTPLPTAAAEKAPAAALIFWDKERAIKPGRPVTVVVAGYGQKHVIPEAGPGYDPGAELATAAPASSPLAAPDATLQVYEAKITGAGHLLRIDFTTTGIKRLDPRIELTYAENPETGERQPIVEVPRIGLLAPLELENHRASYMVIDNAGKRIKPGQKVNVAVSGVRQEGVPVTREREK